MNILMFHPLKSTLEMMSFCLESQIGLTVHQASTFQEAIDRFLEESSVDLVITSQEPETDKLFKYLLSTDADIPVIIIGEKNHGNLEVYPDIRVVAQIQRSEVPDKLIKAIRENFGSSLQSSAADEYCRINTELLARVVPLRGDIFIRLSSVKFVKLFRMGAVFTSQDLEKYLVRKKVSYLFVKKTDCQEFVDKFKDDLAHLVEHATPGDASLFSTVGEVQDLIQELSGRLGFTKEVQELVHSNIKLTIKAIGASPKLTRILGTSQLRHKNYITSHSVMLANVACSIAAQMRWPSNTTFHKLAMASLFHDISFVEADLARVANKEQLDSLQLGPTDEKYLAIKNHPIKCADLIKTLHEVPADVDIIVLQHHERPDGTGFPKGLRAHQIAPLSAVFIAAHDILNALDKEGDGFDLKRFVRNAEGEYQGSAFKRVWKALMDTESESLTSTGGGDGTAA